VDPDDARRPLFVATGTGIAPLLSMIEGTLRAGPGGHSRQPPILIHGVSRACDLAYRGRLEALAARGALAYLPAVSRPSDPANAAWTGAAGRVDGLLPDVARFHAVDPLDAVAYVCGNPGMTEAATATLVALGLPPDAVRAEAYWTPQGGAA
jgi:ferredoxin-NADP reductase